jgi:hypothetical protein
VGRAAVLGWLAAAAIVAAPGPAPAGGDAFRIERKPEFVEKVNAAIDRGVGWLRGAQEPGGPYKDYGPYTDAMTALAYYTLRVCGVPRDDPAAVKAFDAMRQAYDAAKRRGELKTYTVGLLCMALAEHGDPVAPSERDRDRDPQSKLDVDDTVWMKELVKLLEDWQTPGGRWSYPMPGGGNARDVYDNSNTQYALLGLKAASRAGVRARTSTWMKSLRHFLEAQEDDGPQVLRFEPGEKGRTSARAMDRARGWGYVANAPAYGSMTAGGVGSVVICRSELLGCHDYPPGLDAKAEQSARDGLAWLGAHFRVDTNPSTLTSKGVAVGMAGPQWHYYYLYAMERAGMLAYVEWMGEHDWYGEGADYLVGEQLSSGAWVQDGRRGGVPMARANPADEVSAVQTTCFALLFLKKGTLPVARGALTKSFDDTDINFGIAASLSDADFSDFVDLVLSRWRRAATEDGKERLFAGAVAVGPRIVLPLIDRLSSTKDAEREAAFALLRRATGQDLSYDPAAARDVREDAIARWQEWWLAKGKSLRFDAAAGRLVVAD